MPSYEIIGYGSPDGSQIGRTSTEKIGFYGGAPGEQVNISTAANGGQISSVSASSQCAVLVSQMIAYFVSTGLFRAS